MVNDFVDERADPSGSTVPGRGPAARAVLSDLEKMAWRAGNEHSGGLVPFSELCRRELGLLGRQGVNRYNGIPAGCNQVPRAGVKHRRSNRRAGTSGDAVAPPVFQIFAWDGLSAGTKQESGKSGTAVVNGLSLAGDFP